MSHGYGGLHIECDTIARCNKSACGENLREATTFLCDIDCIRARTQNRHAIALQPVSKPQRGLTAQLNDCTKNGSTRALSVDDRENILQGERFEIETVTGVVVGGHRLGVAVDHDGFIARVGQGERGVNTGIVELDSLTDAVGPGPDDDDLRSIGGDHLGLGVVRRVVVRRQCRELARTRVHRLEHGADVLFQPERPHSVLRHSPDVSELNITKAVVLCQTNRFCGHRARRQFRRHLVDQHNLVEEPRVNRGCLKRLLNACPST